MLGKNKVMRVQKKTFDGLMVHELFCTIQGEGIFSGHPAVFVRLSGCNLQCSFCDTEFESYFRMHEVEILAKAMENQSIKLVVITGGEPLLQDVSELCSLIISSGMKAQIETNGTVFRDLPEGVYVVCSPKFHKKLGFVIDDRLLKKITVFKFLISANIPEYSVVPEKFVKYGLPIYIQPMDEMNSVENAKNLDLCIAMSLSRGYILSPQMHKVIKVK